MLDWWNSLRITPWCFNKTDLYTLKQTGWNYCGRNSNNCKLRQYTLKSQITMKHIKKMNVWCWTPSKIFIQKKLRIFIHKILFTTSSAIYIEDLIQVVISYEIYKTCFWEVSQRNDHECEILLIETIFFHVFHGQLNISDKENSVLSGTEWLCFAMLCLTQSVTQVCICF